MKQTLTAGDRPAQTEPARVRAGSPTAFLALVPYLLGFMPQSSLVVVGTEPPDGTVKVTLRYDLPDPADPGQAAEIAGHALAVIGSQHLTAVLAVGYGPEPLVQPLAQAFRDAIADAAAGGPGQSSTELELIDFLRVTDGRYWSYTCTNQACCPPDGTPFDVADRAEAAVMAGAGRQVLADRGELAASIAPLGGVAAESMRQATRRAERHLTQLLGRVGKSARLGAARQLIAAEGLVAVADLIAAYRAGGKYASDYQVAWLTVALKDIRVRDDAWARMDPRYPQAHLRLWTDVVRRAQPGHVAAPASLLAFVAWQAGNGALANVALDRALANDGGYSMALLLRQVISAGAPPSMARLPMTPEEVAACYELADDTDLDEYDDDSDDFEEEFDDFDDDDDYPDDGDRCPCGTSPGG
ncbi:MAG: DUF4192 domain-containing protein [Streptosporangiaceae bacterium]|nr:DUF4192 domain-containing protein [Streptosporangiaceae bacterium]